MTAFIEKNFGKLLAGMAVFLFLAFGVSLALREHDARILADQHVKESAARVVDLENQVKGKDAEMSSKLAALKKIRDAVKTPAQALAEIPKLTDVPLNVRPLPDSPSEVAVQAVPLFQDLAQCKDTSIRLSACTAKLALQSQITGEEKGQVTALKNRGGSFWQRFGRGAKVIGCAAGGGAIGGLSKQPGGAAIGAGVGAGLCSIL
jgi:hypothetical protein